MRDDGRVRTVSACGEREDRHLHVACWNCGAIHCMAARLAAGYACWGYACACGCAEAEHGSGRDVLPLIWP